MNDLIGIFIIIFLWGNIWCVPGALAGIRRREKKPMYPLILIITLAVELLSVFCLIKLSEAYEQLHIGVYASPLLASVIGGTMYWYWSNKKDESRMAS